MAEIGPTVVVILTTSVHLRNLTRPALLPHAVLIHKPLTREKVAVLLQAHCQHQLPV
ncbi:hypothetical protein GCM10022406_04180 [Hymenobacter algoricola]|uniref:Response regulatory domain-containing protein n=1 Tax=Hymenobacter algoricola TaxID=486267 RepID=A0ABP7MH87_9BACT